MTERLDLTVYMRSADNPGGKGRNNYSTSWYAGSQLDALAFYMDPEKVKILASFMEAGYQGNCYAIMKVEGRIVLWRDSFGSCSGCDSLEDSNGYEYIKDTLQEGNTRQFITLDEAKEYIKLKHTDYWWDNFPTELFDKVKP